MSPIEIKELLEAGVHFGHKKSAWNPKMSKYIYAPKNGIHIIDLRKTVGLLDGACEAIKQIAFQGSNIVFVGTKKQASEVVKEEAERCGAFYINRRWLGGTLTNFETIRSRVNKLKELEELRDSGHFDRLPKKEVAVLTRQLDKLSKTLGGIKNMKGTPDALVIIDQKRELIAVKEGKKMNLKLFCLADSNADPTHIDYIIPGNDDSIRSIKLVVSALADAIAEGKTLKENAKEQAKEVAKKEKETKLAEKAKPAKKEEKPVAKAEPKAETEKEKEEKAKEEVN